MNAPEMVILVFRWSSMVISILIVLYGIYLYGKGILPVLLRLGNGLAKRKICVFSENRYSEFESMLLDSKIFSKDNIIQVHKRDMDKAKRETLLLVDFEDFANELDDILENIKQDNAAVLVYCPAPKRIPDAQMSKIENKRNTIVVTFRGRLLNDIVTCMITTHYENK